jgi:phosphoribosylaminoimidazole-succinocarboxamide synthase
MAEKSWLDENPERLARKAECMGPIKEAVAAKAAMAQTSLPLEGRIQGKVRDIYDLPNNHLLLVATDRQSAFDRILAAVPFKGQVLNMTAAWWFKKTESIVPNGLVSVPDANCTAAMKVEVFPVEFVVRGYITGSTDTSLWTHYKNGARTYCGISFPDGMKKNEKLAENVVTPTTKAEHGDAPMSPEDLVKNKYITKEDYDYCAEKALAVFKCGQEEAGKRGLILVDTKFEFGKDANGKIYLIDEVLTPDSSRYWAAATYEDRMKEGKEPENFDKEFLRLWFKSPEANCDPYKDEKLPEAPASLVEELSWRYICIYEMITGNKFDFPPLSPLPHERIVANATKAKDAAQSGDLASLTP